MDYLKKNHLVLIVIAFLGLSAFSGGNTGVLGALDRTTVSNPWTFAGAVTHSGTFTQTGDATFSGGDGAIVVTTTNTATSSVEVGCIQMTATSTASPIKIVPAAISTTTTSFGFGTTGFPLVAVFGTCP